MSRKLLILIALSVGLGAFMVAPTTAPALAQGQAQCLFVPAPVATTTPAVQPTAVPVQDQSQVRSESASPAPDDCADATPYPGPFTNHPTAPVGPYAAPIFIAASADQVETISADDSRAEIAHSGSESFILAYIGSGLVAFGAVALGSRRRLFVGES